jgi:hypothetical protein
VNFSYLRGNVVSNSIDLSTERLESTFNYETNFNGFNDHNSICPD